MIFSNYEPGLRPPKVCGFSCLQVQIQPRNELSKLAPHVNSDWAIPDAAVEAAAPSIYRESLRLVRQGFTKGRMTDYLGTWMSQEVRING